MSISFSEAFQAAPTQQDEMLVTKSVKVHGDTHDVLKAIKEKNRNKSMDEVIRSLIKGATGKSVEEHSALPNNTRLSSFAE
jgi:hypothetical protein